MLKTSAKLNAGTEADGLSLKKTTSANAREPELGALGADPHSCANESRYDPITGNWTIFAPHREQRPDEFQSRPQQDPPIKVDCPFCAGAEANTPPALWVGKIADAQRGPAASGESAPLIYRGHSVSELPVDDWTVRVVPNRFPAIAPVGLRVSDQASRESKLFPRRVVTGGHEVIIEAPRHVRSITELDLAEVSLLFTAYRDRIAHWHNTEGVAFISVFKNVGGDAGASLKHSHSQLVASDIIPPHVRMIADRLANYRAKTGCCLQCDLIRGEIKEASRVISKSDSLVAYCPFASAMPMTVRVTSIEHLDRFDLLDDQKITAVSRMVSRVISWLEKLQPDTPYNMLVHTRPAGIKTGSDAFHWSIDIFPRLTRIAGFEFSTETKINPVMPEAAAKSYRDCAAAEDPRLVLGS